MASSPGSPRRIRAPRGWLGLAFLGVWTYFLAQTFQLYVDGFASGSNLTVPEALDVLRVMSNLGQILFLSGIAVALWRANLAAGLTPAGVRGLAIASGGVGVLLFFEAVILIAWVHVVQSPIGALSGAYGVGSIVGVALGLAGIASLGVGLTQAAGFFGPPGEAARLGTATEKSG